MAILKYFAMRLMVISVEWRPFSRKKLRPAYMIPFEMIGEFGFVLPKLKFVRTIFLVLTRVRSCSFICMVAQLQVTRPFVGATRPMREWQTCGVRRRAAHSGPWLVTV